MKSIVKIDLCKSKIFAAKREKDNSNIRAQVLNKLIEISAEMFPHGDKAYPKGSYYKAEGDAIYYIMDKSTVALRCAIEFMQTWYHEALLDFPECRIIIDQSTVDEVVVPGKTELVGKAFENISICEKDLGDGQIFVTESIAKAVDRTLVNFTFFRKYKLADVYLQLYVVNYLDPRTIDDSSLIHALFVANPKATKARERVIELFLIEYLLEKGKIIDFNDQRQLFLPLNDN